MRSVSKLALALVAVSTAAVLSLGHARVGARLPDSSPAPYAFDLPAPELVSETSDWLNTDGKKLAYKKGEVTVIHFWTFG